MKNTILQRKSELEDQRREKKKVSMLMEVKRELLNRHLYPAIKQQAEVSCEAHGCCILVSTENTLL